MKATMVGILTETLMHPGSGQNHGAIDLPVAREVTTSYPVVVGSSMKGALKDKAEEEAWESKNKIFGEANEAGAIAVSDGRLLLLPVRSLQDLYFWATCPHLLERWLRDAQLAGATVDLTIPKVEKGKAFVKGKKRTLYLEELSFETYEEPGWIENCAKQIAPFIHHPCVQNRLPSQLVVLNDYDFVHFARYGLSVHVRNKLDNKKTSENLWTEECLPPDTLLYTMLLARPNGEKHLNETIQYLQQKPYIQIGGNETVGQGWCILSVAGKEAQA